MSDVLLKGKSGKRSRSASPPTPSAKAAKSEVSVKSQQVAAFLFRRDFRLHDNTALIRLCGEAQAKSLPVLPLFFFNPLQADDKLNPYFGKACFRFLCQSLIDLDSKQLHNRLVCLRGSDAECLGQLAKCGLQVSMLGFNEDFTPFALQRDAALKDWCSSRSVGCVSDATDFTLLPLDAVLNGSGQPYSVFTPFANRVMADFIRTIRKVDEAPLNVSSVFFADGKRAMGKLLVTPSSLMPDMPQSTDDGGRTEGLRRMERIRQMKHYADERNDIAGDKTSHLSPHLKFGTVSIREVWHTTVSALGSGHAFARQLIWREFYAMLLYDHPRLAQGQLNAFSNKKQTPQLNSPFLAKYYKYRWSWDAKEFERFKAGQTGVPLVDAAVRCVNATGWCHNRCRMVLANFLVKVLSVDWREGERWFANVAVDFDVANNNGGWLWSSGQGADAQPYFRTFNPFLQSKRFDPQCEFIYRWVPELRNVSPAAIHTWDTHCAKHAQKQKKGDAKVKPMRQTSLKITGRGGSPPKTVDEVASSETSYPPPMVDIRARTQAVIADFKKYDTKK